MIKKILLYILSILTIVYIFTMSILKLTDSSSAIVNGVATYGGFILLSLFAFLSLKGKPLKLIFSILLILGIVFYCIVYYAPDWISSIF